MALPMIDRMDGHGAQIIKLGDCEVRVASVIHGALFKGEWVCQACKAVGVSAGTYTMATAALSWARAAASVHCRETHP
jgi:hypothetical protein